MSCCLTAAQAASEGMTAVQVHNKGLSAPLGKSVWFTEKLSYR